MNQALGASGNEKYQRFGGKVTLRRVARIFSTRRDEVALAVNDRYGHAGLTSDDLSAEFDSWGIREARELVQDTLSEILEAVESVHPDPRAHAGIEDDVRQFTRNLLNGKAAGRPVSVSSPSR